MDPDVSWSNGRGCSLVVHYWADLQSVHGFRCYDNSAERQMSASACTRSIPGLLWSSVSLITRKERTEIIIDGAYFVIFALSGRYSLIDKVITMIIFFIHQQVPDKLNKILECGSMPNVIVAQPNIGGDLCEIP